MNIVVTIPKGWFKRVSYRRKGFIHLKRKPKSLERGDRVYICYEGKVDHYYDFKGYDEDARQESLREGDGKFYLDFSSYHKLKRAVKKKGFRGFRYWSSQRDA